MSNLINPHLALEFCKAYPHFSLFKFRIQYLVSNLHKKFIVLLKLIFCIMQ